jgi:hypothetical protein
MLPAMLGRSQGMVTHFAGKVMSPMWTNRFTLCDSRLRYAASRRLLRLLSQNQLRHLLLGRHLRQRRDLLQLQPLRQRLLQPLRQLQHRRLHQRRRRPLRQRQRRPLHQPRRRLLGQRLRRQRRLHRRQRRRRLRRQLRHQRRMDARIRRDSGRPTVEAIVSAETMMMNGLLVQTR